MNKKPKTPKSRDKEPLSVKHGWMILRFKDQEEPTSEKQTPTAQSDKATKHE